MRKPEFPGLPELDQIYLAVYRHGPITTPEISERLGIPQANIRRVLNLLEREGEIAADRKKPSENGAFPWKVT